MITANYLQTKPSTTMARRIPINFVKIEANAEDNHKIRYTVSLDHFSDEVLEHQTYRSNVSLERVRRILEIVHKWDKKCDAFDFSFDTTFFKPEPARLETEAQETGTQEAGNA